MLELLRLIRRRLPAAAAPWSLRSTRMHPHLLHINHRVCSGCGGFIYNILAGL
jgi:hypothetical protein